MAISSRFQSTTRCPEPGLKATADARWAAGWAAGAASADGTATATAATAAAAAVATAATAFRVLRMLGKILSSRPASRMASASTNTFRSGAALKWQMNGPVGAVGLWWRWPPGAADGGEDGPAAHQDAEGGSRGVGDRVEGVEAGRGSLRP